MKKKILVMIALFLAVAGLAAWYMRGHETGDPQVVRVSGNIEVTSVGVGFKIPGRLLERLVDEGEEVYQGQVIALLESEEQEVRVAHAEAERNRAQSMLEELEAGSRIEEIRRAEARVEQARLMLEELESGSRSQEIADAEAELERAAAFENAARSEYELAVKDFERFEKLFQNGGISRREFDNASTRLEKARNALEEASARVESARQRLSLRKEGARPEEVRRARAAHAQALAEYALVKAGPRKETIAQARAGLAAAEEALKLARQQAAYTKITAPFQGVVLVKSAEPGAYLSPGVPVVTIGRLSHIWLRAFVPGPELGRIQLGQRAVVRTDAHPDKTYDGTLSFIGSRAEFTPKSVQTFEERVNLMYRIKITLENPLGELKPGMPADAVLEVHE